MPNETRCCVCNEFLTDDGHLTASASRLTGENRKLFERWAAYSWPDIDEHARSELRGEFWRKNFPTFCLKCYEETEGVVLDNLMIEVWRAHKDKSDGKMASDRHRK